MHNDWSYWPKQLLAVASTKQKTEEVDDGAKKRSPGKELNASNIPLLGSRQQRLGMNNQQ